MAQIVKNYLFLNAINICDLDFQFFLYIYTQQQTYSCKVKQNNFVKNEKELVNNLIKQDNGIFSQKPIQKYCRCRLERHKIWLRHCFIDLIIFHFCKHKLLQRYYHAHWTINLKIRLMCFLFC